MEKIKNRDLPNTVIKSYDNQKTIPEATSANMQVYLEKINELVVEVNRLTELNIKL
jgi:hypothetical protein